VVPVVLVLYNNLPLELGDRLSPYEIRVGMYGLETIIFSIPKGYLGPTVIDRKFGPKRKLTEGGLEKSHVQYFSW